MTQGRYLSSIARAGCAVVLGLLCWMPQAWAGCNSGDVRKTILLADANCQANASAGGATAVGGNASAQATSATAMGFQAQANGHSSSALGASARANGLYATVMGLNAGGATDGIVAMGANAGARGFHSTSLGGANSVAHAATAVGGYSIAIGGGHNTDLPGAKANGFRSIAIGQNSASADFGTSVGFNTNTFFASTAIGTDAQATADSSTAVGRFAKASANGSLALGQGAVATKLRSVALGSSSLANVADTVSVGTNTARRRIVNVQNGVANSDAATLGQVKAIATSAAIEALSNATVAKAVGDAVSNDLQRELNQMRSKIKELQLEVAELKSQKAAELDQ